MIPNMNICRKSHPQAIQDVDELISSPEQIWRNGLLVDYCDVFISFLLKAPIHCRLVSRCCNAKFLKISSDKLVYMSDGFGVNVQFGVNYF